MKKWFEEDYELQARYEALLGSTVRKYSALTTSKPDLLARPASWLMHRLRNEPIELIYADLTTTEKLLALQAGDFGNSKHPAADDWPDNPEMDSAFFIRKALRHETLRHAGQHCDVESGLAHRHHVVWNICAAYVKSK